jgi:hypothetical protein
VEFDMTYIRDVQVTNEIEVKNDVGNPLPITGNVVVTGSVISNTPANRVDAFGRSRVSSPFTLFESYHRYKENDKWSTAIVAGGSKTYDANASVVNMIVAGTNGDSIIRETYVVMSYQPGKSLLVNNSFVMSQPVSGLRQRVGYFGAANGVYFEADGTTLNWVLRSSSSGTLSENRIARANWNTDRLDGTGPSAINISSFDKALIQFIDIEWLGVGDVRVGFVIDGLPVICHIYKHSAYHPTALSTTYMSTGSLPLRYEITNTANVGSPRTLKQICSTVISEGGHELNSRIYCTSLGVTVLRLGTAGTIYPIISIKLNSSRLDSIVIPSDASILVVSNQRVEYMLLKNATITTPTWNPSTTGNVDIDKASTSLTGGTVIYQGYINTGGTVNFSESDLLSFHLQIGRSLANVSDIITLAIRPDHANTDVLANLSWYEVT